MISLPFLRKNTTTVGLDIGSSLIKVVEIDHSGAVPRIVKLGFTRLLPEAIVEGEIMDRNLVVDGIRECFEQAGIQTTDVVSAVSGRAVIVKKVVMDKMPPEDAQEAIFWEAEQHVPFDIDDVCLDFQILREDIGANQMEVLLVAAKKDMVNMHAELIREAGLNPRIIDVDSFAVQNCFERNASVFADGAAGAGGAEDEITGEEDLPPVDEEGKVVGLINIGSDVTNLNIIQNDCPHFTRDISIGTNSFVEAFQKELGVGYEDAVRIVSGDLGGRDEQKIKEIIKSCSSDLSLGIERSISFLKTAGDAETIDRIVLSGGGARIPFLAEIIAEKHGIMPSIHNPLDGIEYDESVTDGFEEDIDSIAPLLTVGIGLALRKAGK
ncbi:MAG: type IV pilus assembly protein PilM [Candidatus Krumholzibacteriota bacterium]|nr:type IV pilus assembly protein PilM [Candidatus Krumholzibacteriota bacterium]